MKTVSIKQSVKLALLGAALSLASTFSVSAAELKFASFVPPQHTVTASMIDVLAKGVAEETGGALTIRNYPGGELGKGPVEQYVRVVQGAADMSWGLQGYTSSQFPKTMLIELPGMVPLSGGGYEMLWNAYEAHLASEYPATRPLALWVSEPNVMIMREKEIRNPDDLAGLKIRVAGAVAADVVTALGATPVQMPIPEVYNALQTGLIDGVFTGASTLSDFKLAEVAGSVTVGAPLGRIAFYAVMNEKVYKGLPEAQRQAIDNNSGRMLSKSAEDAWQQTADTALAAAAAGKTTVIELSAEEIDAFAAKTLPVAREVIGELKADAIVKAMKGE